MPTIIDLGQKVKAKYPQYSDMSDEEVGKRVKAKYPGSYDDFDDISNPQGIPLLPRQKTQLNPQQQADKVSTELFNPSFPARTKRIDDIVAGTKNKQNAQTENKTLTEKIVPKKIGIIEKIASAPYEFGVGALKGAGSTAATLGQLTLKAGKAISPFESVDKYLQGGIEEEEKLKTTTLKSEGTMQYIGKTTEQIAEFFTPAGITSKARIGAGIIKKILVGAGEMAGVTAAQTGDLEKTKEAGILGGAFPVLSKIISKIPMEKISSLLTNVPKDTLQRAYKNPSLIDKATQEVVENPQQPFYNLAQNIGKQITSFKEKTKEAWSAASEAFKAKYPDATFDVSYKIPELKTPLAEFNLGLKQLRDSAGKLTNKFIVDKKITSPFTDREISEVNKLVEKLRKSSDMLPADVTDLRQSFDAAYDAIPLSVNGSPKRYHALVMSLKNEAEKFIDGVLPKELKNANNLYKQYYNVYQNIGNKIVDGTGNLKPNAEQFLSNIQNMNKGEVRKAVVYLSRMTGFNINAETMAIKDAKKLLEVFATTGSRTQDILRALLVAGGGAATGGLGGIAATGILTSPKVAGEITKAAGRISRSPVIKKIKEKAAPIIKGAASQFLR